MEFLLATIVMTYTACILGQKFLDLIVKISLESIYGSSYKPGTILIENLLTQKDGSSKISVELIRDALGRQMGLTFPDFMLKSPASWPEDMAPYVWEWIHVVTVHIDLNGGDIEKKNFVYLVEHVILCGICRQHFIENMRGIEDSIKKTSLTNTFLALHTHITATKQHTADQHFTYDIGAVSEIYKKKYFNLYSKIKQRNVKLK